MGCITDYQPNVPFPCKFNSDSNVLRIGNPNGVANIHANDIGWILWSKWFAKNGAMTEEEDS